MHRLQRGANLMVGKRAKPTHFAALVGGDICPDYLDQKNIGEPLQKELRANGGLPRFRCQQLENPLQGRGLRAAGPNMNMRGKQIRQRFAVDPVETELSTDDRSGHSPSAERNRVSGFSLHNVLHVLGTRPRIVSQRMLVTLSEQAEAISTGERDWFPAPFHGQPTVAPRYHAETGVLALLDFQSPGRRQFQVAVDQRFDLHGGENVCDWIHVPSLFLDE